MVDKTSGCWVWTGKVDKDGYGRGGGGRNKSAHRFSYQLAHGPIPKGVVVRHTCDNRRCVRPDHLMAGTHAENIADRDQRGHTVKGERHWSAKLTAAQVEEIRRRYAAGESRKALAEEFHLRVASIWNIGTGKTWRVA